MRGLVSVGCFVVLSMSTGCPDRPLEIPEDGGADLSAALDMAPDLAMIDLATTDRPPPDPCPAGTEFIFTIDEDRTLSRFSPTKVAFFDVGRVACPTTLGGTPNSMAIDRDGNGWVNYSSGELFRLITMTATCTKTPYAPGQGGLTSFGMSFAENSPGSSDETLWVSDSTLNNGGETLASIDLTSYTIATEVSLIGGSQPELTGDDNADLWGFFPSATPPFIARIDKTAGLLDHQLVLPAISGSPDAWGVAAWQGNFYVFLQRAADPSTKVYLVDGTTGALTTVIANTHRKIVGVGVATCAGNNGTP